MHCWPRGLSQHTSDCCCSLVMSFLRIFATATRSRSNKSRPSSWLVCFFHLREDDFLSKTAWDVNRNLGCVLASAFETNAILVCVTCNPLRSRVNPKGPEPQAECKSWQTMQCEFVFNAEDGSQASTYEVQPAGSNLPWESIFTSEVGKLMREWKML